MNNIYIFLFLATTIVANTHYLDYSYTNINTRSTEQEKEIDQEKLYAKINRNIDFYSYEISIGKTIPLNKHTATNFKAGESISLTIKTPYKSPKILNRFTFNISSEISIKNFKLKQNKNYNSNYNIFTLYLMLNNIKDSKFKYAYGLGVAHLSQANKKSLSLALKLMTEYTLNFNKLYNSLINNHILNEKESIKIFLKKLKVSVGFCPELIFGFPGKKGQTTLSSDIYCKINLFNL